MGGGQGPGPGLAGRVGLIQREGQGQSPVPQSGQLSRSQCSQCRGGVKKLHFLLFPPDQPGLPLLSLFVACHSVCVCRQVISRFLLSGVPPAPPALPTSRLLPFPDSALGGGCPHPFSVFCFSIPVGHLAHPPLLGSLLDVEVTTCPPISHPPILSPPFPVSWCLSISFVFLCTICPFLSPLPSPSLPAHLAGWGRGDLWEVGVGGESQAFCLPFVSQRTCGLSRGGSLFGQQPAPLPLALQPAIPPSRLPSPLPTAAGETQNWGEDEAGL